MPTGQIDRLGPDEGLRRPRALRDIPLGFSTPRGEVRNLLFRRSAGGISAGVRDPRLGYEVRLDGSLEFGALVLFTPPGTRSVSLEPRTCVPNAFNLARRDVPTTGLVVLEGHPRLQSGEQSVDLSVERLLVLEPKVVHSVGAWRRARSSCRSRSSASPARPIEPASHL
jgi:hypothetical protein